jgi:hypothetical protein
MSEPVTLTERVAYALCANDIMGLEGRLEDSEFRALQAVIHGVHLKIGRSPREIERFFSQPSGWHDENWNALRRFLLMEEHLREEATSPHRGFNGIGRLKIVLTDWPNYMRAASAAVAVLAEDPKAAKFLEAEQDEI